MLHVLQLSDNQVTIGWLAISRSACIVDHIIKEAKWDMIIVANLNEWHTKDKEKTCCKLK